MNIFDYFKNLYEIGTEIEPFLDWDSKDKLEHIYQIFWHNSKNQKGKNKPIPWRILIERQDPLIFNMPECEESKIHVDVTCDIQGIVDSPTSEETTFTKYNLELRVWSHDEKLSFREGIDSNELREKLERQNWKRVMLRFHMDMRSPTSGNPEPICHLHAGGDPHDDEYCWIPKELHVPRFYHYPMDIILLSEFILTNFYPEDSERLRKDPVWKSIIIDSQNFYLKEYILNLQRYLNRDGNTLFGYLVSYG